MNERIEVEFGREAGEYINLPEFEEWSLAAVRLLQDVVYSSDVKLWGEVLDSQNVLRDYFARIGLTLTVDEANGFAYLRQLDSDTEAIDRGYAELPKLYRQSRFGYAASLMCVILREELRRFETEEVDSDLCVVAEDDLFEQWKAFFPDRGDEKIPRKEFMAALKSVSDAGFAKEMKSDPPAWEVRRILKAKLDVRRLEQLRDDLAAHVGEPKQDDGGLG